MKTIPHSASLMFGIALFSLVSCAGQESTESKVYEYVQAEIRAQHIPGVSLAIMKAGQVLLAKGYGLANVEHQAPVKPETVFQSGSMGKHFTATAVMMLVEAGKIALDDKITKYFTAVPSGWTNVSVRHLLTHTAGFTGYPKDFDLRRDYSEDELIERVAAIPPTFAPGENGTTHPYGFGWSLGGVHGRRMIEHGGAWQGFKSYIARYPDDKLTVVVFANLVNANVARIAHDVAAIYDPELAAAPPRTIKN